MAKGGIRKALDGEREAALEKTKATADQSRESFRDQGFVSLYANDIQVETSPWDVRLTIGEVDEAPTEAKPSIKVKHTAEIRMSPQQALALVNIVGSQLSEYERVYGKIPMPPRVEAS